MYPPPENGALACNAWGVSNRFCQVSCNDQFDFAFPPAISYLCGNGIWTAFGGTPPPWPSCSGKSKCILFHLNFILIRIHWLAN